MARMQLIAMLVPEGDGYTVHCPQAGSYSQGDSIEHALAMIQEATELSHAAGDEFMDIDPRAPIITTFNAEIGKRFPPIKRSRATSSP